MNLITKLLEDLQINPNRLSLEWVSAAEAPRFVALISAFSERIQALGPLGTSEGLEPEHLMIKLKAARMALEGKRLRMVIARQAKYMKQGETYREIPPEHKLHTDLEKTLVDERAINGVMLYLQDKPHPLQELASLLEISSDQVMDCFKKLEKRKLVGSDRLVVS